MRAEEFVSRLDAARRSGDGWVARCPAHDDRTASLSIHEREDRVLLHCHAGCSAEDVAGRVGVAVRDLFNDSGHREIERVYEYTNLAGEVVHEKLRYPGKEFRQRRPDGAGDWIWNLRDIEPVLYRLPEVEEAILKRKVFVVEGEKDVEAIREAGGVATCNSEGAGKWRDSYTQALRLGHIVIVADRDDVGVKHAIMVRDKIGPHVASVRIVQAKEGKDAHDHLAAGFGLADFEPLLEEESVMDGLVLRKASSVVKKNVEWIPDHQNMLAYGAITTLFGPPGVNKSTFSLRVASILTRDRQPVIFFAAEDGEDILRPRLDACGADVDLCYFAVRRRQGFDSTASFPSDIQELERAVRKTEARLVVVDTVSGHLDGNVESNSDQSMRRALAPLGKLAEKHRLSVLLISHLNKTNSLDPITRAGGSIGLPGISRMCLLMGKHPDNLDARAVVGFKNNWGPDAHCRVFRLDSVRVEGLDDLAIVLRDFGTDRLTPRQILASDNNRKNGEDE